MFNSGQENKLHRPGGLILENQLSVKAMFSLFFLSYFIDLSIASSISDDIDTTMTSQQEI